MTAPAASSHYRGRFAPSPTGPLHMGSLVAALGSWLLARHAKGEWLLRIEDVDRTRESPGSADGHLRALSTLGMTSDEPVWRQSLRSQVYSAALDRLVAAGLAFQCWCSRQDLAAAGGIHRRCVARPSADSAAWRLRVPDVEIGFEDRVRGWISQPLGESVGDFVLRRADGCWSYQLAVVVDDDAQGITEVVRGADLLDSTPRQIYLQQSLGLSTPRYRHLPLIRQADGQKLGKSVRSAPFDLEQPLATLALAYQWLGQDPQVIAGANSPGKALECALRSFRPDLIPASDLSISAQ